MTLHPIGYGRQLVPLRELESVHGPRMHPEFRRRLFNWLASTNGLVGIGGGWRATQPNRPGFAPPGRSFHESQHFASGLVGYAAVDLVAKNGSDVHRAPTWAEVLPQDTPEAARWGVHSNIGKPGDPWPTGESWHMQPVEIDGWSSWVAAGRPDPAANYPIPQPVEDDMEYVTFSAPGQSTYAPGVKAVYLIHAGTIRWISPDVHAASGAPMPSRAIGAAEAKRLTLIGPSPDGARHFARQVA